jgi:hypothetical protein
LNGHADFFLHVLFFYIARSTTRLVSYMDDDQDEDADSSNSEASDDQRSPPPSFGSLASEVPENVRLALV